MARGQNFDGKEVFIVGGSGGLGKEMAKVMASQGANITIFSRSQSNLDEAKAEILAARKNDKTQKVDAIAADMGDASTAQEALTSLLPARLPDTLILVAGGTPDDLGFLADNLGPQNFENCMKNNYYSSVYPSQTVLKQWIADDASASSSSGDTKKPKTRKLVFVNSSASLIPTPGYLPYSAAKAAQRALADTLRLEVMRYNNPKSRYVVQCVFAHNFITPTFIREQKSKPALTKRIEGTAGAENEDAEEMRARFPLASKIAPEMVAGIAEGRDDFAVMDGRLEPQILWAGMVGSSPKRGWGVWDWFVGVMMHLVLYPSIRKGIEKECEGDAFREE
ncbi:hypothetical protein QBC44DRAFT_337297 [Cladorrhinum sp. PSN332]|nr:hypothetical protein QBC44DRAFT_337297 [Cladorrhinum sp. PSN332]